MIKQENHLGSINISQEYFANLIGKVVSECFGVSGMVASSTTQGIKSAVMKKKNIPDKGVRVRNIGGKLVIDLNISVSYGINITTIVKSIMNKVRYSVEQSTDLTVTKVNVFVDSMIV